MSNISEPEILGLSLHRTIKDMADSTRGHVPADSPAGRFDSQVRAYQPDAPSDGTHFPLAALDATRTATAGVSSAGGFSIMDNVSPPLAALRAKSVMLDWAQVYTGLTGNLVMPTTTTSATATWATETAAIASADIAMEALTLSPHRCGGSITVSTQLLAQTGGAIETYLRNEIASALATALDLAALVGTGTDGQPLGIINNPGITADLTFGGAAAWADLLDLEEDVDLADADTAGCRYFFSPESTRKLKAKERASGSGFCIEGDACNGYPYASTTHLSDAGHIACYGDTREIVVGIWGPAVRLVVDPYALKKSGQVEIVAELLADTGIRRPSAWACSTDACNQ